MKLSKAIIKKYGISKKAWAVQRGMSGSKSKSSRRSVRKVAKKKSYRKSAKSMFGALNTPIMGAAGVVLYEGIISPMIPLQGVAKNMLELVGGLWLSKKRGFAGATGKTLVVLNSYQLINGLVGDKLQGLIGNVSSQNSMTYGAYN